MTYNEPWLEVVSDIIGWIYFFAWSASFYGQLILNYKRKSVEGMKLEFQMLNFVGFSFYTMYTIKGRLLINPEDGLGDVSIQDTIFAIHALTITILQCIQIFIYPRGTNKVSRLGWILFVMYITLAFTFALVFALTNWITISKDFNYWKFLGYMKLSISCIKYIPQVLWNYQRKSTVGWSIFNILMDFTGGLFSVLQNVISIIQKGWGDFNIVKFSLGNLSMAFDIIFMIQHYGLYYGNDPESQLKRNQLWDDAEKVYTGEALVKSGGSTDRSKNISPL